MMLALHSEISWSPSSDSTSAGRAQIDEEIRLLYRTIRSLKSKRNALAPISRLPNELFVRIFSAFQSSLGRRKFYDWVVVSQVSRHWRSLVLNSPLLWSRIVEISSFRQLHWAGISLERSGECELDISIHEVNPSLDHFDFILAALSQLKRIRAFDLIIDAGSYTPDSVLRGLIKLLGTPAPCLQELRLDGELFLWYPFQVRHISNRDESIRLFGGVTPSLRSMRITYTPFDLHPLSCDNLLHLELYGLQVGRPRVSISSLLLFLCSTPYLQSLRLEYGFFTAHDHELRRGGIQPVNLLCLETMTLLTAELVESTALLYNLTLSQTTRLKVQVAPRRNSRDYQELEPLFDALSRCFGDGIVPLGRLNYRSISGDQPVLEFWEQNVVDRHDIHYTWPLPPTSSASSSDSKFLDRPQAHVQNFISNSNRERVHTQTQAQLKKTRSPCNLWADPPRISLYLPPSFENPHWFLDCRSLPLLKLSSLKLSSRFRLNTTIMAPINRREAHALLSFANLPLLEDITLEGPFVPWFVNFLFANPDSFAAVKTVTFCLSLDSYQFSPLLGLAHACQERRQRGFGGRFKALCLVTPGGNFYERFTIEDVESIVGCAWEVYIESERVAWNVR